MKKITKRYLSVLLTFALVLALPLAATQEVNAASGGKKINQPVQVVTTSTDSDGTSSSVVNYVYNKKGLVTEALSDNGYRTVYTYSKTGIIKTRQRYNKSGVLVSERVNTIKGKKLRTSTFYDIENGQRVLDSTTSYKYKKGKLAKETWVSADGKRAEIITYRKNGKQSSYTYAAPGETRKAVFDKRGNMTSKTITDEDGTVVWNYVNKYKKGRLISKTATRTNAKGVVTPEGTTVFSYTKKGLLKSSVYTYTDTYTDDNGAVVVGGTQTETTNYTYTKAGLVKSKVYTYVWKGTDGTTETYSDTTNIAYKKIKTKSKVRKEVKKSLKEDYAQFYIEDGLGNYNYYDF